MKTNVNVKRSADFASEALERKKLSVAEELKKGSQVIFVIGTAPKVPIAYE